MIADLNVLLDSISETIVSLDRVQDNVDWSKPDLAPPLTKLAGDLATLRFEFTQILRVLELGLANPVSDRFRTDLEICIAAGRALTGCTDGLVVDGLSDSSDDEFAYGYYSTLDKKSWTSDRVALRDRELLDSVLSLLAGAGRLSRGLNVLLKACQCKLPVLQDSFLQKPPNRRLFRQIRSDGDALNSVDISGWWTCGLRGWRSRTNGHNEKSIVLLQRGHYTSPGVLGWLGSLLFSVLPLPREAARAKERSAAVDGEIEAYAKALRRECCVLVSAPYAARMLLMDYMQSISSPRRTPVITSVTRATIRTNVLDEIEHLFADVVAKVSHLPGLDRLKIATASSILDEIRAEREESAAPLRGIAVQVLDPRLVRWIDSFWADPEFAVMRACSGRIDEYDRILLDTFLRASAVDFAPTALDHHRFLTNRRWTFSQGVFDIGELSLLLYDPGRRQNLGKRIHFMENATALVHAVDLAGYDEECFAGSRYTRVAESVATFETIVNSRVFYGTAIVLVVGNVATFRAKLMKSPLSAVYKDYRGGNDWRSAAKYLCKMFLGVNRSGKHVYLHVGDLWDPKTFDCMMGAVRDKVLSDVLLGSGTDLDLAPGSRGG